jgi:hypothetical protein
MSIASAHVSSISSQISVSKITGIFPLRGEEDELLPKAQELNDSDNNTKTAKMIRRMDFNEKTLLKYFVSFTVRPPI